LFPAISELGFSLLRKIVYRGSKQFFPLAAFPVLWKIYHPRKGHADYAADAARKLNFVLVNADADPLAASGLPADMREQSREQSKGEERMFARVEDVLYAAVNPEEAVMLGVNAGRYYGLNAVAMRIWEMLETPMTPADLCECLQGEFAVDAQTCAEEVQEFLS
jgi:hypothetical protein